MLECVINVSEGRDEAVLGALRDAAGTAVLDVHADARHNRSVFTLAGPDMERAARALAATAVTHVDIGAHGGAHPRLGAVDVVPFVPLERSTMDDAVVARGRFAGWASEELGVPCFLYGAERSLPDVRRSAFRSLAPDVGPPYPHPTAGAICVGARPVLIAYNVWLVPGTDVSIAGDIATAIRGPAVRALGLDLGGLAQVSMNLVDWRTVGPADAYDAVVSLAEAKGTRVSTAELVGLLPEAALESIPEGRWDELGVSPSQTIETRLRRTC